MHVRPLVVSIGLESGASALEACLAYNLVLPSIGDSAKANVGMGNAESVDVKSRSAISGGILFVGLHRNRRGCSRSVSGTISHSSVIIKYVIKLCVRKSWLVVRSEVWTVEPDKLRL